MFIQQQFNSLAKLRRPFPQTDGGGEVHCRARRHFAGPSDELFGVTLAAGELGGYGIGKGFLVEPHAATHEPQKRLGPE